MTAARQRRLLWCLLVGLGLRLLVGGAAVLSGSMTDPDGYLSLAQSLADGLGYRFQAGEPAVAHRAPLTVLLMTPAALAGDHWQVAWLAITTLMGLAMIVLGRLQSNILQLNTREDTLYVWGITLLPFFLALARMPTALPAATLSTMATATAWLWWHKRRSLPSALASGAGLGLMCLAHPSLMIAALAIVLGSAISGFRRRPAHLGQPLLMLATGLVILGPWLIHRAQSQGTLVPYTGGGLQFWIARAEMTGQPALPEQTVHAVHPEAKMRYYGVFPPETDARLSGKMLRFAQAHPGDFAAQFGLGLLRYWAPLHYSPWKLLMAVLLNGAMLALVLTNLLRRPGQHWQWLVPVGALWAGSAVFLPQSGYFIMSLPFAYTYILLQLPRLNLPYTMT